MDFESIMSESYGGQNVSGRKTDSSTRSTLSQNSSMGSKSNARRDATKSDVAAGTQHNYVSNAAFGDYVKEMFERAGL